MNFDNALELQYKIFSHVFNYIEASEYHEFEGLNVGPFYTAPYRSEAARQGAQVRGPLDAIAVGIGISPYSNARRPNRDYGLVIFCQDRRLLHSPTVENIHHQARGESRAVYVGPVRQLASWEQFKQRPLRIGSSVGHTRVTAGTLGCFVKVDSHQVGVLSNNHVLAHVNQAQIGDIIIQPGRIDGGTASEHRVATLHRYVPVALGANARNFVDAAVATLLPKIATENAIYDAATRIGNCGLQTVGNPDVGESVIKVGRTTGFTRGRIQALNVNMLSVAMSSAGSQKIARFDGQIAIEGVNGASFSKLGDSGSLVMNDACEPIGLIFAGSKTGGSNGLGLTYANPIDLVLKLLDCELLK